MIECRYIKPGSDGVALATVGFQVKSPVTSFPSILINQGLYGVELKIAKGVYIKIQNAVKCVLKSIPIRCGHYTTRYVNI